MKKLLQFIITRVCVAPALFSVCALQAANVVVLIQNYAFSPAAVTINVGDTITWQQLDGGIQHTATSQSGAWDSGSALT